jgi:DNA repair protein RecN (Recombination protein N)
LLAHLRIRDLVLIEELELELSPGFNVLTGETGAGKSLVVTALDLLLGRRGRSDLVRHDAAGAEVEGLFDISDEPAVRQRLVEAGLPADEELLVRRVIPASGRHRCYVNGKLSSLAVLSSLAAGLANVTGQHEHHSLVQPAAQLALLDGFGGHGELCARMAELHGAAQEAAGRLDELRGRERDRANRLDYVAFQLAEIDEVAPEPDEVEELEREIGQLRHHGALLETARRGADELYEADGSIYERLGALGKAVEGVVRYDETLAADARQLAEAAVLVEDAARRLADYGANLTADPERLEQLEDRRERLGRLVRKHGTDLAGVLELRESLAAEAATLERFEEAIADAERALESAREEASACAADLTRARRKTAAKLGRAVSRELGDLAFERAVFAARLEQLPTGFGPTGADRLELLVTLNPGEGEHPLGQVASGGELSRLMLAVQRVLAGVGPVGTHVFDEVDAGVGGQVAAAVGNKLREVAAHHQVICVTHLPQISALADAHFRVSKARRGRRTVTRVEQLGDDQRLEELARMLGGAEVTDGARAAARELIAAGQQGR